ncbi:MAG: Cys-Gln thioester bond-forming surface protein [Clostridia bacterium]|nr:Cys-Gln thioester bond-forming surface protein [Clostridia bacterium]
MKKAIKIITVVLLIMILNFILLINTVQAVEQGQINIYTKGEFKRIIRYNGIVVKTAHAVYQDNGIEYPAYCLNKDLHGVGEHIATYDVTYQGKITDVNLWKVIINGYPYKSIEQLGVLDEGEAYTATKQAVYCYIYNRGTEGYSAIGEAGNRVINAINIILQNARNSTESFDNHILVKHSEEWQKENDYISKECEIQSNINISKFIVNLENQPYGCKTTNLENQEKNEFSSNEKFKILIPINSLEKSGQFKIKIKTQMETKPIFFGKAPSADLQDYALTAFSFEDIDTEITQDYEENKTKIIIEKQDTETQETLKGAKFEILDEQKEIFAVEETDEGGQIILEHIMPGIYYIREIQSPEGYEIDSEVIQIDIKMNEEKIVQIKNNKIQIPEEPPVEQPIEETTPVIEEPPIIEIPKLPVTGM